MNEMRRTLQLGGTLIVNSWAYMPNIESIQSAAKATRPSESPLPRDGMQKWAALEFTCGVVGKDGFEIGKVWLVKKDVMHRVRILNLRVLPPSFGVLLGGTTEAGWNQLDEEKWDDAIEVVKEGLRKTDDFKLSDSGKAQLKTWLMWLLLRSR